MSGENGSARGVRDNVEGGELALDVVLEAGHTPEVARGDKGSGDGAGSESVHAAKDGVSPRSRAATYLWNISLCFSILALTSLTS